MTTVRSDEALVGLIALLLVPVIGARLLRAVRTGRVPLYRTSLEREDDRLKFAVLLAFHLLALLAMAWIGLDLLQIFSPGA